MHQIKQYREDFGFKYKGMKSTLKFLLLYMPDVKINAQAGIKVVEFYYEKVEKTIALSKELKKNLRAHTGDTSATDSDIVVVNAIEQEKYFDSLRASARNGDDNIPFEEVLTEEDKLAYLSPEELEILKNEGEVGLIDQRRD